MTILITATANSKLVHVTCFFFPQTWEYLVSSRLSGWRPLGLGSALQPGLYGAVKVRRRHVRDDAERSSCVPMEIHFWGNNLRAIAGAIRIPQPCRHETGLLPPFAGVGHARMSGIAFCGGIETGERSQRDNRRCVFRSCRLFQITKHYYIMKRKLPSYSGVS